MAAPANTQNTFQTVGNREDLENKIYKIAANRTPFTSNIGTVKVEATYHEWQTSALRTPDPQNKRVEGDVTTSTAPILTIRPGNRTQIFSEAGSVSGTQEAVISAGRTSEKAWQVLQKGEIVATDIEARFLGNFASVTGNATTPRESAGAQAWMTSNVSRGVGGASGGFSGGIVAAATNGTQRAFTEQLLKDVQASAFNNGAKPTQVYVGAKHKQQFSGFTGIADIRANVTSFEQATIYGGADVYVGDFGKLVIIPVQYGLDRAALLIDPEYWKAGTLRPINTKDLAVTGDSMPFQILGEKTLVADNEKSSAIIADLL